MARHEAPREDLMRDAVALQRRIALRTAADEMIVAGRRRDDHLSLYFGEDPVYHFDAQDELRRAFVEGALYRTEGTTLARLIRQRDATSSTLLRHDLSPDELAEFFDQLRQRLQGLFEQLESGAVRVIEQIPPEPPFLPTLQSRLQTILIDGPRLAASM